MKHLTHLAPAPANLDAITELLKLVISIIRDYPGKTQLWNNEEWSERFDP
jgi:hypothetical protein